MTTTKTQLNIKEVEDFYQTYLADCMNVKKNLVSEQSPIKSNGNYRMIWEYNKEESPSTITTTALF